MDPLESKYVQVPACFRACFSWMPSAPPASSSPRVNPRSMSGLMLGAFALWTWCPSWTSRRLTKHQTLMGPPATGRSSGGTHPTPDRSRWWTLAGLSIKIRINHHIKKQRCHFIHSYIQWNYSNVQQKLFYIVPFQHKMFVTCAASSGNASQANENWNPLKHDNNRFILLIPFTPK